MYRPRLTRRHVVRALSAATAGVVLIAPAATGSHGRAGAADRWDTAGAPTAVVGYRTRADLARALRAHPGVVLRTIPALGVAEILPRIPPRNFASATGDLAGVEYVEPPVLRASHAEPALQAPSATFPGRVLEWQYPAAHVDAVPDSIKRAAAPFTIAVVDTGADLNAPDIGHKGPQTYSVVGAGREVHDSAGHGTFVAALAAGSDTNGDGMAGFGGRARLMVVQASRTTTAFTDFDEAEAIVWAVDHGARIVNLSLGGPDTSTTERNAVSYAVKRGALVVASIGNEHDQSNPVEYPAALLQPVGSNGRGGTGLSVGASDETGARASFSATGSHLSLVAPGFNVLSAVPSGAAAAVGFVKVPVPGSSAGVYALGSGTSFAAPEVSGVAALVWAANPGLSAQQVARIIEQSASNDGVWNAQTGYGVLDASAAVALASRAAATYGAVARLTLSGSTRRGKAPLSVSLQASLSPALARQVVLESFTNGGWQRTLAGRTNAAGKASWQFVLDRGAYRMRARFAGDAGLRPAVSPAVSVSVS